MHAVKFLLAIPALAAAFAAVPAPAVGARAATTSTAPITSSSQMVSVIQGIIDNGVDLAMTDEELLGVLNAIVPLASPTSIPDALSRVAQIYAKNYQNLFTNGADILLSGLTPGSISATLAGQTVKNNDTNSLNPVVAGIYPRSTADAPYDVSEDKLRQAIYIPPGFTYGKVRPLIFVPGTASYAGQNFGSNAGKLFAGSDFADPVYLNIPGAQLDDIQTNSEYIAYAINYVSSLTHGNVSLYTWSAGAVGVRWANKYWPSTRDAVTNVVSVSADFHGTSLAYGVDPQYPRSPDATAPSIVQQEYNSTFIATLRNNGGDGPYAPLTSIFSVFDQIVEPQGGTGVESASGYSEDPHHAGVTNLYLQAVCPPETPGGAIYNTHEGLLYNALAIEAARDALRHGDNAKLSRFNATAQCTKFAADGLSLEDILSTEAVIPVALEYASRIRTRLDQSLRSRDTHSRISRLAIVMAARSEQ